MTASEPSGSGRLLRWTAAALLLAFGFLPIVNWIPGGHEAPWYGERVREWLMDGALVLGVGVLLAIVSRRVPWLWRPGWFDPIAAAAHVRPGRTAALLGVGAFALYAVIAQVVFSAKPLLIDEIIQVWQARVLVSGRLWVPTPEFPEFTAALHLVDHEGRRFGQFPMGGPAMLAIGSLLRAEWLVGPLFGGVSAMLAWVLFRRIEPRGGVALGAALLFALAPFTAFMAGSHMNHVTTLTWILVATMGLVRVTSASFPRWYDGFICGLGIGMAMTIRPVDAVAFGVPAAIWLVSRSWRVRRPAVLLGAAGGVVVPVTLLLFANIATTGQPFLLGYQLLWGPEVGLGFHSTLWAGAHTPANGAELVSLYLLRLQSHFLDSPIPGLLLASIGLWYSARLAIADRYLLLAGALLLLLYGSYWHDGFYLGPRYLYPLMPVLSLWIARAVPALRDQLQGLGFRAAVYTLLTAVILGSVTGLPIRFLEYRSQLQSMRVDHDSLAEQTGAHGGLILVRESWGSQLVARMWGLGVSVPETEFIYPRIDTCQLELIVSALENSGLRDADARRVLAAATADSSTLVASALSGDRSQRVRPGFDYPQVCLDAVALDQAGFTLFPPAMLARGRGTEYARDLGPRNQFILDEHPERPVYLLKPPGPEVGLHPVLTLLRTTGQQTTGEEPNYQ